MDYIDGALSAGAASTGHIGEANFVEAIASWCEATAGIRGIEASLKDIAGALGASVATISRYGGMPVACRGCIALDLDKPRSGATTLQRAYSDILLGEYMLAARPGTLWFSSMVDNVENPALREFQIKRGLREMVAIPLKVGSKEIDLLELHFTHRLTAEALGRLNVIVSTLVRTWANRSNGLFADALLSKPRSDTKLKPSAQLLSVDNPARLSRSEYRLCLLLSHGLTMPAVEKEMGITHATARSHLRNIYAKVDVRSLAELVFKLMRTTNGPKAEATLARLMGQRA